MARSLPEGKHLPADTARAAYIRFLVVALTTLISLLLFLDRLCLSFAERYIKEDSQLSNQQMSVLLGSFFFAYALAQVPSGWLSDRYGARLMLVLYILLWSVFTGVMGLAVTFAAVLALRFGCGLAQAGAYPTSGGVVSKWVPFSERGMASGIVSLGGRVGGPGGRRRGHGHRNPCRVGVPPRRRRTACRLDARLGQYVG
jgi:sugar phosphate permease